MSRRKTEPVASIEGSMGTRGTPNWASPVYWTSAAWNQTASDFFYYQLCAIAMARYRWVNLPPKVDERFLEYTLLRMGCATITFPEGLSPNNAFAMIPQLGTPNGNDEQYQWRAVGSLGRGWPVTRANGVMVWDSQLRIPKLGYLRFIASECGNIMRTKQTVRQHMRQPVLITAPREQAQQLHNLESQIANGEPYILAYDQFRQDVNASVLPVASQHEDTELVALESDLKDVWNLALAYLGIGVAERKSERQSVLEIQQTEKPMTLAALDGLVTRRKACEELNKLTGGAADVFWNQDFESDTFNALNNLQTQLQQPASVGLLGDEEDQARMNRARQ